MDITNWPHKFVKKYYQKNKSRKNVEIERRKAEKQVGDSIVGVILAKNHALFAGFVQVLSPQKRFFSTKMGFYCFESNAFFSKVGTAEKKVVDFFHAETCQNEKKRLIFAYSSDIERDTQPLQKRRIFARKSAWLKILEI